MVSIKKIIIKIFLFLFLVVTVKNGLASPLIGINKSKCELFYSSSGSLPLGWLLDPNKLDTLNLKQAGSLKALGHKWDQHEMTTVHLPTPIAKIVDLALVSQIEPQKDKFPRAVEGSGYVYSSAKLNGDVNGINIQDMLIKIPNLPTSGNQSIRIPSELLQFREVIDKAMTFDRENNPNHEEMYAYITISQSTVKGGRSQRRKGAHVDGLDETTYLKKGLIPDHTYIVSSAIPTHFFDQTFPIDNLKYEDTLEYFDRVADPKKIVTYEPGVIALMDSYTVHEVGTATEILQPRTFIKITFSFNRFAMAGNSLNPSFRDVYNNSLSPWNWKLRGKGRNSTSK